MTELTLQKDEMAAVAVPEGTVVLRVDGVPMRSRIVLRPADGGDEQVLALSSLQDGMTSMRLFDLALTLLGRARV
jgi:hypothetical protein